MDKNKFNSRRFKYGTVSTVITVVFIAVVVLVNIVSTMLLERYPTKIDLTYNKLYELSDSSKDYIAALDKQVEITVLNDKANLLTQIVDGGKQLVELLEKYDLYSDNVTVKFIDPDKNPNEIKRLNTAYNGDVSGKLIVIQCGDRVRAYAQTDLIKYDTNMSNLNEYKVTSNVEQTVTSAIMYITDDDPIKITVMESAEEVFPLGNFENILTKYGYDIEIIDAVTGEIDKDSSFVVVNCPVSDFTDAQIKKLDDFLFNDGKLGKNLLYIPSIGQIETPKLDAFLADWGIKIGDGYVDETNSNYSFSMNGGGTAVIANIAENEFSVGMENTKNPLIVPFARPIELMFDKKDNIRTVDLLSTTSGGRIIPSNADEKFNFNTLPTQKTSLMAVSVKTASGADIQKSESKVFIIGSPLIFSKNYTEVSGLNNEEYPIHILNKITGKGEGIALVPKTVTDNQLSISVAQKVAVKNISTIIIPIIIIAFGIFIWARRRRR